VEAIGVLRVARSGAVKARTQAANQLRDLLVTAPSSCTPSRSGCRPPSGSPAWWPSSPVPAVTQPAPPTAPSGGASPVEASSGKTVRHRLNRGGDRQANNALWVIALSRLRDDPPTRAYAERRTKQGKTTKDTMRCLTRYLARGLLPLPKADLQDAAQLSWT
jgi:transposase